jgi:hypothetical protein
VINGEDDYETACRRWAEGRLEVWGDLRPQLEGRTGWTFDAGDEGDEPLWAFMAPGSRAPRLVVTVQYEYVRIYDVPQDEEISCAPGDAFGHWLDLHESDYL